MLCPFSAMGEHSEKLAVSNLDEVLTRTQLALCLKLPASRPWEINFLHLSATQCEVLCYSSLNVLDNFPGLALCMCFILFFMHLHRFESLTIGDGRDEGLACYQVQFQSQWDGTVPLFTPFALTGSGDIQLWIFHGVGLILLSSPAAPLISKPAVFEEGLSTGTVQALYVSFVAIMRNLSFWERNTQILVGLAWEQLLAVNLFPTVFT